MSYKIAGLIVFLLIAFAPATVAIFGGTGFVAGQILPAWTPPAEVFPIVWNILYTLIGIAGWRVWFYSEFDSEKVKAYVIYLAQLILNAAWSVVFWVFNSPIGAFFVILVLLYYIYLNSKEFCKLDTLSGYMLVPYFGWVAYAATINLGIIFLNFI